MSDLHIKVEPRHIRYGTRADGANCIVALAIREAHPSVFIWVSQIEVQVGERYYAVPDELANYLADYDAGVTIYPTEFNLERRHYV